MPMYQSCSPMPYWNTPRNKMKTSNSIFSNSSNTTIVFKTPTVEFKDIVPNWFIQKFIDYMGKGLIRVTDYQGNELKVYYSSVV